MSHQSFQVYEAEDEDPDDVQEVPVQRENKRFVRRIMGKSFTFHLKHEPAAPQQTHRHVGTVGT
ncbi:hypothetical protein D3C87_2123710 [compost metagenome]